MRLEGTRFGEIEFDDARVIEFPRGLIGFPEERRFVLLEPANGRAIAWLQSLRTPGLAFPVIDGAVLPDYPSPGPDALARDAALAESVPQDKDGLAVLVIVAPRAGEPRCRANLLAPIVVDVDARRAAQVVLDPRRYSASATIALA